MRSLLTLAAIALAGTPAVAETTLKMVSGFPTGLQQNVPMNMFIERVNETCSDVKINFLGGPETVPTFEQADALRRGVVDITYATFSYISTLVPESAAYRLSTNTVQDQRENGAVDYMQKLYGEKMNARFLARAYDDVPFYIYFNTDKEPNPLDLKGFTLRGAPSHRAFLKALGANMAQIAPGETYTALERGVVQGYAWPGFGTFDLGWDKHTKYRVEPGYYIADTLFFINLDRWNELSDEGRTCLDKAGVWIENQNEVNLAYVRDELKRQETAGIQVIKLEGKEAEKYLDLAGEAGWAELAETSPDHAAKLKELMAPGSSN